MECATVLSLRETSAVLSLGARQELVYSARASLDRTRMQVEDRFVTLAGMAVTTEIRTGSRTIISYLLSPLIRYHLRERSGRAPGKSQPADL
jgi:hypothetical protein